MIDKLTIVACFVVVLLGIALHSMSAEARSYPSKWQLGCDKGKSVSDYYSGRKVSCNVVDVDHLVSQNEAKKNGLNVKQLKVFANDPDNLVLTHRSINRSKGDDNAIEFIRRAAKKWHWDERKLDNYTFRRSVIMDRYNFKVSLEEVKLIKRAKARIFKAATDKFYKLTDKRWKRWAAITATTAATSVAGAVAADCSVWGCTPIVVTVTIVGALTVGYFEVREILEEFTPEEKQLLQEDFKAKLIVALDDKVKIANELWEEFKLDIDKLIDKAHKLV